jgi:prolyl oligopeptidase
MKKLLSHLPPTISACASTLLAACAGTINGTAANGTAAEVAALAAAAPAAAAPLAMPPMYPPTARGDVTDDYRGTKVADPYRWLEQLDSDATRQWVRAENEVAQPRLEAIPQRQWIKQRLKALWDFERFDVPEKAGEHYMYLRNDGTQNQSVLYVSDGLSSQGRVLFDPNSVRSDATVSLSEFTPSADGKTLAYALSDGGTDWQTWKFRTVEHATDLEDTLSRTKFWGVSWAKDGSGVYYSLYPARADGRGDDAGQPAIHFHKLGEPQDRDRLVYAISGNPTRVPQATVTEDGRYLIIGIFDGYDRNDVSILDLTRPNAKARPLFAAWDALYTFIGAHGDELYFQTTNQAPRGRVIAVDARHPAPSAWRTIVPEADIALEQTRYVGGRIIVSYVRDAHSTVRLYEPEGRLVGDVPLPGVGQVQGFTGKGWDTETFFSYTDYLTPVAIYRYDPRANSAKPWHTAHVRASTEGYVTDQSFYPSKDGTRIPMSITHRRDMPKDGNQPVLLYGYGGFNSSEMPTFRPAVLAWLEMGGVYAVANLRGGGEYGEAWHEAGTRTHKQNVFDDFIAAAEYLIREGYTRPQRLAIHGRSNGGLLVGATLTQRPDLFGAALPAVGVLDMLRYQTASANARQWSSDYGLSEDADEFKALYAYSPYHNVKAGTCYPPTLLTTADHDDRVVPWHSYKFAAALQNAQGCPHPVLIRVETRAGHGAGKPVWMQIEDFADQWAFLAQALGVPAPIA